MPMLVGLSGGPKNLEAKNFTTPRQAIKIIEAGKGAWTAGENGSLTVWRDRKGILRGELGRFLRTIESAKFEDFKTLSAWLKPRLEEIRRPNAIAAEQCKVIARMDALDAVLFGRRFK
jgi:hypothetical protein